MCGRFTLTVERFVTVATSLGATIAEDSLSDYRPRYNIAPGNQHWVLRSQAAGREIVPATWGLINHWAKDPKIGWRQINARAETLARKPAFREAFRERRCVVIADGFYEWRGPRSAREPLWFHAPDRGLLLFAGLYESWRNPDTAERRRTFTIITTAANEVVAPVHDRMPAVLLPADIDTWLTGEQPQSVLRPVSPAALAQAPASTRVNSVANDDPGLLDPADPARKPKQLALL